MSDPMFDQDHAADYIDKPTSTLQWWRHVGKGPRFLKIGRTIRYRQSHLDEYLAACERTPGEAA